MHLGGLLSTQEARVALGCRLRFFRAYQPPACIHNSMVARYTFTISQIVRNLQPSCTAFTVQHSFAIMGASER